MYRPLKTRRAASPVCQITVHLALLQFEEFAIRLIQLKFTGMKPDALNCCFPDTRNKEEKGLGDKERDG